MPGVSIQQPPGVLPASAAATSASAHGLTVAKATRRPGLARPQEHSTHGALRGAVADKVGYYLESTD